MDAKLQRDRYLAQRSGIVRRLRHARLSEELAEHWVATWEQEAQRRGLDAQTPDFWRSAWDWIAEQRGLR
jgi:hypothetical protein